MNPVTFNNMRFYVFMQRNGKTELIATFADHGFAKDFADEFISGDFTKAVVIDSLQVAEYQSFLKQTGLDQ